MCGRWEVPDLAPDPLPPTCTNPPSHADQTLSVKQSLHSDLADACSRSTEHRTKHTHNVVYTSGPIYDRAHAFAASFPPFVATAHDNDGLIVGGGLCAPDLSSSRLFFSSDKGEASAFLLSFPLPQPPLPASDHIPRDITKPTSYWCGGREGDQGGNGANRGRSVPLPVPPPDRICIWNRDKGQIWIDKRAGNSCWAENRGHVRRYTSRRFRIIRRRCAPSCLCLAWGRCGHRG